jgi:hypothetical protein
MQELREWDISLEKKSRLTTIIYLSLCSAFDLSTLKYYGQEAVVQLEFELMRHHHINFFLEGLKRLGLENEATDAIKCAKYHYFSNALGGLDMEYVEETPEKVWIRYLPPYGFSDGPFSPSVAIAAFTTKQHNVSFEGWHAYNGVSLKNPRLGYVITHLFVNADPYDAGYFKIYDHDLRPDERLQFNLGEMGPPFDPAKAPKLDPKEWPEERKLKALRNYAVEYVFDVIGKLIEMFGITGARPIIERAYRVTLAARYKEICKTLQIPFREVLMFESTGSPTSAKGVATLLQRMRILLNEEVTIEEVSVDKYILRQSARNPRFFPNLYPVEVDEAELGGWRVLVQLLNPSLTVDMTSALTAGDPFYEWVVKPRRR